MESVAIPLWAVIAGAGASAAATVGGSLVQADSQRKAANTAADEQKAAQSQALAQAEKQEKTNAEAQQAANRKSPNIAGLLDSAQQAGKAGPSSTMLTGAQGVDPGLLTLGRKSLLGG